MGAEGWIDSEELSDNCKELLLLDAVDGRPGGAFVVAVGRYLLGK